MPFSKPERNPETEHASLEGELAQLEAELGPALTHQADKLAEQFPPDAERVLSRLGLALAKEPPVRRSRGVWLWKAAACLAFAVAGAAWLLYPGQENRHPVARWHGAQVQQTAGTAATPEPAEMPAPPAKNEAARASTEAETASPWLLSSEELEGIADLEQPGFALGI